VKEKKAKRSSAQSSKNSERKKIKGIGDSIKKNLKRSRISEALLFLLANYGKAAWTTSGSRLGTKARGREETK